jgi:hypothetical protein
MTSSSEIRTQFILLIWVSIAVAYHLRSTSRANELYSHIANEDPPLVNFFDSIKEVTFVSSNVNKIQEVKLILGENFPWKLNCKSLELPEPQASPVEISIAKCKQAAELCNGLAIYFQFKTSCFIKCQVQ